MRNYPSTIQNIIIKISLGSNSSTAIAACVADLQRIDIWCMAGHVCSPCVPCHGQGSGDVPAPALCHQAQGTPVSLQTHIPWQRNLVTTLRAEEWETSLQDTAPNSKSIIYANTLSKALPQMFLIKAT